MHGGFINHGPCSQAYTLGHNFIWCIYDAFFIYSKFLSHCSERTPSQWQWEEQEHAWWRFCIPAEQTPRWLLDGMQKNRMKYLQWLRYLTTLQILDVFTRFFFFFKVLESVLGSHNNVVKRLGSCHLPIPTPGPFPCFLFPLLHKCQPDEDDHALSCLYALSLPFFIPKN